VIQHNKEENLTRCFQIAEEKLGIPKLLEVEDMIRGGSYIDERSVILYSSLFFHAFVADEQRRALAGETTKITSKLQDVQTALEEARARNAELEAELQRVREQEVASNAAKIAELEEKIRQLLEEIKYLRDRSLLELEMRQLLEDKVAALHALIDQTAEERASSDEERAKLRAEIHELRARSEKLSANLDGAEHERTEQLTSAEERESRLRDLENRKSRLLAEIQELRDRIALETARRLEKTAECERLKNEIALMKQREIVQSKARLGLDLLKQSLEEHLEDLHHWRNASEIPELATGGQFDLAAVIADLSGKNFETQIDYLGEKLRQENSVLQRSVALRDSQNQLLNVVLKEGSLTMKGRKEWRQRWFRIVGSRLNYYEDENSTEIAGSIQLDQGCEVVRQKAVKDDAGGAKKLWPLKLTVGDRKLFVKAATKKERHAWFLSLTSKIAHLNYVKSCEQFNERPDTRILSAFAAERFTECYLDSRPLSDNAVLAISKGFPGRDEIEVFSATNASLSEKSQLALAELFEKLTVKNINLSHNHFTPASVARLCQVCQLFLEC
jgi:predicted  nucleic acid-binding Zn-ribbon protein